MIGWLDASAGASGDMLLGAYIDAGADLAVVQRAVDSLAVEPVVLRLSRVRRHQISSARVEVQVPPETGVDRPYREIRALLDTAQIADAVRVLAQSTFGRLARAEAAIHDVPIDEVHLHEVGALDSLADVVGVCAAYVALGSPILTSSAVAVGSGRTQTRHGVVPVPVPAVLAVCADAGIPIETGAAAHEACTPTGAALIAELCSDYGVMPPMIPVRIGVGAGGRDPEGAANICRLVLGEPVVAESPAAAEVADGPVVIEANIDDQDPRLWPVVIDALLAADASDAWISPIVMKKGRPAHTLHVLCRADQLDPITAVVFAQTTTIGLRVVPVTKRALERRHDVVEVDGHQIGVKIASQEGVPVNVSVEFDDAKEVARLLGRPVKEILARATAAAWSDSATSTDEVG